MRVYDDGGYGFEGYDDGGYGFEGYDDGCYDHQSYDESYDADYGYKVMLMRGMNKR